MGQFVQSEGRGVVLHSHSEQGCLLNHEVASLWWSTDVQATRSAARQLKDSGEVLSAGPADLNATRRGAGLYRSCLVLDCSCTVACKSIREQFETQAPS